MMSGGQAGIRKQIEGLKIDSSKANQDTSSRDNIIPRDNCGNYGHISMDSWYHDETGRPQQQEGQQQSNYQFMEQYPGSPQ